MKKISFFVFLLISIMLIIIRPYGYTNMNYVNKDSSYSLCALDLDILYNEFDYISNFSIFLDNKCIDYQIVKFLPKKYFLNTNSVFVKYYYQNRNNTVYLFDPDKKYVHDITFDENFFEYAYEVDVYSMNKDHKYSLILEDQKLYYHTKENNNIRIKFTNPINTKIKIIFKNSKMKIEKNQDIHAKVTLSEDIETEYLKTQTPTLISSYSENDKYYYLYDFRNVVFVNNIHSQEQYLQIKSSRDNSIFTTMTKFELENGLQTRFLLLSYKTPIDTNVTFQTAKRFILFDTPTNAPLTIRVNHLDDNQLCMGYSLIEDLEEIKNYKQLTIEDFKVETASINNVKSNNLLIEIIAASILFLIYPVYLLFKYIKKKSYLSSP